MTILVTIREMCEIFGVSDSRMRDIASLPDFPERLALSPRCHRWSLEQVLAFHEHRAAQPRTTTGRVKRPVAHTPGARIAGAHRAVRTPHSADGSQDVDRLKIVTPEGVTIYPPFRDGDRWRAMWRDPDGQPRSCTARSQAQMAARLKPVAARLRADAPSTLQPSKALIELYLEQRRWSASYRASVDRLITTHLLPRVAGLRCDQISVKIFDTALDSATNYNTAARLASVIGGLVQTGLDFGYLADRSLASIKWHDRVKAAPQPRPEVHGQAASYVHPREIPGHDDVAALAAVLGRRCGWRMELAVHLSAYSGLRFGELAALRSNHLDLDLRQVNVTEQASEFHGKLTVSLPKGGKTRITVYPSVTPSGYPLAAMVERRLAELRNVSGEPDGASPLLFPAGGGTYLRTSNFTRRVLQPARAEAGWSDDGRHWTWHSLRHVFCTTAFNEWQLPLTDVATLAGHTNAAITIARYMNPVNGMIARALAATAPLSH